MTMTSRRTGAPVALLSIALAVATSLLTACSPSDSDLPVSAARAATAAQP